MLGGADNPNGELLSYIIGADSVPSPAIKPMNGCNQPVMKCIAYSKKMR